MDLRMRIPDETTPQDRLVLVIVWRVFSLFLLVGFDFQQDLVCSVVSGEVKLRCWRYTYRS